ncbi:MAG: hypothetical protein RL375_3972 [Pseudomonadota bacterium]|jgi:uncharacterized membrane protein (UPF0127 family)
MIHINFEQMASRVIPRVSAWRRAGLLALGVLLGGLLVPATAQDRAQTLPTIRISAGMYNIRAEVAARPEQRQIGLMHRKQMGTNDGMLFIFDNADMHCFWMRNTLIPLSIAFLADDGSIVNIADMKPLDEASHCPARAVRFALEMNVGWFERRGLKAGSKLLAEPFGSPR